MQYLMNFNILCSTQYGLRKNHSTAFPLIDLHDKISTAFDLGEFSEGIFLDLWKAFDTVNHVILFDKLDHCGIRGLALDWIRSYFSNRKQYVEYNGHRSLRNEISCGVPQGSILGPLFFLLYINDINNASNLLNLILFADDTNVFMSHKDLNYLSDMLNLEMDKLSIWFKANRLSLNLKKTKFVVFKPRQKHSICNIQISIDNQNTVKLKETNFLGVIQMSLRMLYYSLIYPYFYYCNIVWASTYKIHNLHHLVILQKRIIRIINKSHFNAHTDPIFKDLGILKFNDIHLLQLGQFMYSCKNSFLPPKFNNNFSQSNQFHSYNTRNSQAYRLPYCRANTKKFSPFFKGLSFLIHLTTRSSTLNSFPLFRKNWRLIILLLSKNENST